MRVERVDDRVAVALGQPSPRDLQELAARGFRTVINLRREDEEDAFWTAREEGERVRRLGMDYAHLPTSFERLDRAALAAFTERLRLARKPAVVHSGNGARAIALALIDRGLEAYWTTEEAFTCADRLGLPLQDHVRQVIQNSLEMRLITPDERAGSTRAQASGIPAAQRQPGPRSSAEARSAKPRDAKVRKRP